MAPKASKPTRTKKATRRGKTDPSPPLLPDGAKRWLLRTGLWAVLAAGTVGSALWGLWRLEASLLSEADTGQPVPVRITLDRRPNWMPESLAREITGADLAREGEDFRDAKLTQRVYERARQHPWVRHASHARRLARGEDGVGEVELCVTFRRPLARVLGADGYYRYVDAEGCVLPPRQIPRWVVNLPATDDEPARQMTYLSEAEVPAHRRAASIHYITIRGVSHASPGVGKIWPGKDVQEGLRLVELLRDRPYANQIPVVDVHRAPFLRMYAQFRQGRRTEIEFGQFPQPQGDYVVPVERKLAYLDGYVADNDGRLAGIDKGLTLHYDELYVTPF